MNTPSNEQVCKDIVATMKIRVNTGNAQQEWDGFLRHPKTALVLKEVANNEQLFGEFFAEIWGAYGADVQLEDTLLVRQLERFSLEALSRGFRGLPCGLAADLLLKFS